MIRHLFKLIFLAIFITLSAQGLDAQAQTIQNLNNVRVDELSDAQIRTLINQLESSGFSESQLEQVAIARGMSAAEVQKLRIRVDLVKNQTPTPGANPGSKSNTGRMLANPEQKQSYTSSSGADEQALTDQRSKIFGASLFNNSNITFEPNLRIATPSNYVIGPDDEINLEITGYNEASYKIPVSPEGSIRVQYVGIIYVNGLTVEQAKSRIKARLAKVYPAISSGGTEVTLAIANIRSIKVTILGEVARPGSYTLPSLATVFNALYASGGPAENGSLRQIEIIRNNKIIRKLDVYDFLMRGDQKNNIRLEDQDIVRVPPYLQRVELSGEVKRPAVFEILPGENLQHLIDFSGGFTENAYTARVKVLQNTDKERRIADVLAAEFNSYQPRLGDKFFVEPILDRYENRVRISGAVFRPGEFALSQGLTLKELIKKAEGLKEDAFTQRGYINRIKPDNTTEIISFDLAGILNGKVADILLKREDQIQIPSIFDLREDYKLTIDGAVRKPGEFKYADNTALEDLIIQAGGFAEAGSAKRIEVSRRVRNSDQLSPGSSIAQVFQIDVDRDLNFSQNQFILQPFDIVSVRNQTGYEVQRRVLVSGEVVYPGTYVLTRKDERISELIKRAGGFTAEAYVPGAKLKRMSEDQNLEQLKRLDSLSKDSTSKSFELADNNAIGIKMERILRNPGSRYDLILSDGDQLTIPIKLETVSVSGEVLSPTTMVYNPGKSLSSYVSEAGGPGDKALLKRAYVIYANGSIKGTRKFLFFRNYPKIDPGSEIFVPRKSDRTKLSMQELMGITSGIASLGAIILGILNLVN